MLDTVRLKFPISPTKEQLSNWQRHTRTLPTGAISEKYVYNPTVTDDNVMVKFTYYPVAYDAEPMLILETSLPKLIFGNNFQMIQSIDGAVKIGNMLLETIPHIPTLDLAEGILIRLDMCYNHQVGDSVADYINAIGHLNYPHRRTKFHLGEGAEFRSKHKTLKFYDKEREAGTPDAYGILRQEATIMQGKNIQKMTGIKKPKLPFITPHFVKEQMTADLERLRLLNNSIANRDTALEHLCTEYGSEAGIYYFGLLMTKLDKSKKRIADETEMHPRSLDRRLKKIVDSGIPLTLTDRDAPLPPLEIDLGP